MCKVIQVVISGFSQQNIQQLKTIKMKGLNNMELTIFTKKRQSRDGRNFDSYITRLTRKDGTEFTASVKFREECGSPKAENCPCNIIVDKADANLSSKVIDKNDGSGDKFTAYTLWVSKWKNGSKYVDHSLDDIDF